MKIPNYAQELLAEHRLALAPGWEHEAEAVGYYFRLYRKSNNQHVNTLESEAERLAAWARRECADSYTVRPVLFSDKEHRKPFHKRDYILVVITDPVAIRLEQIGNLRRG